MSLAGGIVFPSVLVFNHFKPWLTGLVDGWYFRRSATLNQSLGMSSDMQSPRGASAADQQPLPSTPSSTPRQNSSLLGSLSKMLWSQPETPSSPVGPAPTSPADGSAFMTQSPRRAEPAGASSSSPHPGSEMTSPGQEKRGLLDTLFSPVFSFFGGKPSEAAQSARDTADADAAAAAAAAAAADAAAAAAAQAAAAPKTYTIPSQGVPSSQSAAATQDPDDDEVEEFDAYTFIRNLPPRPPALNRPICLPKKTRGTHPVSLVLDLDETLLHSSIVPLPTYDIVFPVHFNSVNYQVHPLLLHPAPLSPPTPHTHIQKPHP